MKLFEAQLKRANTWEIMYHYGFSHFLKYILVINGHNTFVLFIFMWC